MGGGAQPAAWERGQGRAEGGREVTGGVDGFARRGRD